MEIATATCCTMLPLALAKLPLVLTYSAVIVWLPRESPEVVNDAWPLTIVVGPDRTVAPSLNVTLPSVGNVPFAVVTVAVKVTDCPGVDGLIFDVTVTLVGCLDTTLCTTTLSTSTPQASPGRGLVQSNPLSCVYSNDSFTVLPAMPGNFRCTCRKPFVSAPAPRELPDQADRSCRYADPKSARSRRRG